MPDIVNIRNLPAASELAENDYAAIDNSTDGLRKVALGGIISDLKSDLGDRTIELTDVTGNVLTCQFERGLRYINNGVETFSSDAARITTKRGTYMQFKAGDIIALKQSPGYQYLIGYSANGVTWTGTVHQNGSYVIPYDSIGFITIKCSNSDFPDSADYTAIANQLVKIIRPSAVDMSYKLWPETWSVLEKLGVYNLYTDYLLNALHVNTTAGMKLLTDKKVCDISASKGDSFYIKTSMSVLYPNNYSSCGVKIYECDNSYSTLKRTDITNLTNIIEYSVTETNTTKLYIYPYVVTENGAVTTSYYDTIELHVVLGKGFGDCYTESGESWEV